MIAGWRKMGCALVLGGVLLGCPAEEPNDNKTPRPGLASAAVARAKLTKLTGRVDVKRAAGDDWSAAVEDMDLFENDKVRTVSGASALVVTPNGSITMEADSFVAIPETHEDITVLQGHVNAEVDASQKTLLIKTPAAEVKAGREIFFQ